MASFEQLEALVAVVDRGSFSAAAEHLETSKSLLSRRVSQLESALGTRLLNRTTRSLSLTDAGQGFIERARRILADLDEAEQEVRDSTCELSGGLRVATPVSFGLLHLRPALAEFLATHPGLDLDLDLNDRTIDLVAEGFDMAVRIGDLPDSSLVARRLCDIHLLTLAAPGYLAEHGEPRHPAELSGHWGLRYSNTSRRRAWAFRDGSGKELVAEPRTRLKANNGEILVAAAAAGLGIVRTPDFIAHDWMADGRLRCILGEFQPAPAGLFLVYPPGRAMSRRLRVFADFLGERFAGVPYWRVSK